MIWRIHHTAVTASTNADARVGTPGDVFTADFQTAGRGRLDHKWLSSPGENLMLSAVLDVGGLSPEHVSTLPLVVGLAILEGLSPMVGGLSPKVGGLSPIPGGLSLKWPNDVLFNERKLCGILCERHGDCVIAGIGVNVKQYVFPPDVEKRATSLALILGTGPESGLGTGPVPTVEEVRDSVLRALGAEYEEWREHGFEAVYPRIAEHDYLRGQTLSVLRTDGDDEPVRGVCGGILPDGALDVGGVPVYAGEAHVSAIGAV